MVQPQKSYGESSSFSSEARKYGLGVVGHRIVPLEDPKGKTSGLLTEIARQVGSLTQKQVFTIAFAGFPGVGKTSQLRHMVSRILRELGGGSSHLLSYHHPTPSIKPILAGRIARDGRVGVVHGDHMFRSIGPDRRGVMISSLVNFQNYWGDDEKLARIYWNIVHGVPSNEKIYCGSGDEKSQKTPLGTIELHDKSPRGQKNVMIIEGVQAIRALADIEAMRGKYQTKILKILFDVSVIDSVIRILRRDRNQKFHPDGSPYTFEEILEHRLIEQYYILQTFIGPAYQDENVILLDKPREMPPFREFEMEEILTFLTKYRPKSPHSENPDLMWFVAGLVGGLQDYFMNTLPASEGDYAVWKIYRDQKKSAQEASQS